MNNFLWNKSMSIVWLRADSGASISILSSNAASSCLTSTKGALDMRTLPWIRANAIKSLQADKNIVIMNDFIDGATTDTSIELSRRRLGANVQGLTSELERLRTSIPENLPMPGKFE